MFTINTNSWHYNVMYKWGSIKSYNHPRTVCEYFRRLFFCLIVIAIVGSIAIAAGALVCYSFYHTISWVVLSINTGSMDHPLSSSCLPALVIMGVALVWGLALLCARLFHRYLDWASARDHMKRTERKEPKPNLLIEWIKNRHDKVCTRVEYK